MKTVLFKCVCLHLQREYDEVINMAYEYEECPRKAYCKRLHQVAHDILYHDEFHDEVIEDFVLDVLAKRAEPIETKLIELRKADDCTNLYGYRKVTLR